MTVAKKIGIRHIYIEIFHFRIDSILIANNLKKQQTSIIQHELTFLLNMIIENKYEFHQSLFSKKNFTAESKFVNEKNSVDVP